VLKVVPLRWVASAADGYLEMVDQRLLPGEERWLRFDSTEGVAEAIRTMVIRGAPAIGIAAALGMVFAARESVSAPDYVAAMQAKRMLLAGTRPTAVNLFWALARVFAVVEGSASADGARRVALVWEEAQRIWREDVAMNERMGEHGAALLAPGARLLTHCNAGALATGGYGTALGVVRAAHARSQREGTAGIHVWVDETRPYLQGARLTAWELAREGIAATLITDNMAGYFMGRGEVDAVIIGADRIAANGDVANKIGSYGLAVLARHHGIPFYVAAPSSTFDAATHDGSQIPIEERPSVELTQLAGVAIAPAGFPARHPAFDITPGSLISAIISEEGVFRPPFSFKA